MRSARVLPVILLCLLGCSRAPEGTMPPSVSASVNPKGTVTPSPVAATSSPSASSSMPSLPTLLETATMSYSTRFGSPARSSRTNAASRGLSTLLRVATLRQRPVYVVLNQAGDHAGVAYRAGYDLATATGRSYESRSNMAVSLTMLDNTFFEGGYEKNFRGEAAERVLRDGPIQWAMSVGTDELATVIQREASMYNRTVERDGVPVRSAARVEGMLIATSERFIPPQLRVTETVWAEGFNGKGCGAIADERIAAALQDGRFIVFHATRTTRDSDGSTKGLRLLDTKLPFFAYDISILQDGYGLVAVSGPADADAPPFSPLASAIANEARRVELSTDTFPRWKTTVLLLDNDGHEKARSDLPFEIFQPPIDGGAGRVYLVGMGVAAFQDGKLLYARRSETPMFATAFADGSLAFAVGPELRILDRDGNAKQTFTTSEGEAITAPPAIASDGSVWVGSERALYVAR